MQALEGKRVLFVAPRFFGYEQDIKGELERRGAVVDWLPDRPFDSPFMTAVTKLRSDWVKPAADRLYERLLGGFGATSYDYVLVVNGQTLSHSFLRALRGWFPTAKYVLYMWDSTDNRSGVLNNLPCFDAAFSFDPLCAQTHDMRLRPLFYSRHFAPTTEAPEYAISFVGTAHTDRYAVISKIRNSLPPDIRAFWYLYLQAPWVYYFYCLTKSAMRGAPLGDFRFEPLAKNMVRSVFAKSLAIVDIEHPLQRGLTMRTFEAMGAGKKLVTTNELIVNYDFFGTGNIHLIDRRSPSIADEFLRTPFVPYPAAMLRRYSLAGWVDDVLDVAPPVGAIL